MFEIGPLKDTKMSLIASIFEKRLKINLKFTKREMADGKNIQFNCHRGAKCKARSERY